MRAAEWIHVVVFPFFMALSLVRALPSRRRAKVLTLGVTGLGATLAAAGLLPGLLPSPAATVVRDWLPAAQVLLVYWQAGAFFLCPDPKLQGRLERLDERVAGPWLRWVSRRAARYWISLFLEAAYLLCYPMIPMSIGTLYLLGLARYAERFWAVVLVSTYLSYAAVPFLQTLPPRLLEEPWLKPLPLNPVKRLNLWILRHGSIHANTLPSAHVAASTAAALVIAPLAPWPAALLFGAAAAGIALATFSGRYHFATDAALGIAVAAAVGLAVWGAGI